MSFAYTNAYRTKCTALDNKPELELFSSLIKARKKNWNFSSAIPNPVGCNQSVKPLFFRQTKIVFNYEYKPNKDRKLSQTSTVLLFSA